jgi:hypothetical protein
LKWRWFPINERSKLSTNPILNGALAYGGICNSGEYASIGPNGAGRRRSVRFICKPFVCKSALIMTLILKAQG